ncbi:MAG: hypothetical protein KDC84_16095 [Crocinitomicaceae bacterium]|nr:hypothetical protein [Crocinitomicaceae bacterium]
MTNYEDQILCDQLYYCGVKVFLFKSEIEYNLMGALHNAANNQVFLTKFIPSFTNQKDRFEIREQVCKLLAKGFSNKHLKEQGYGAVDVQKHQYKKQSVKEISIQPIQGHILPNENEWNDVWFLLHYLSKRDPEIIDYVEKVCKIQINASI